MEDANRFFDRKSQQISKMENTNARPCLGASSSIQKLQDSLKLPNTLSTYRADRLPDKMPTEEFKCSDTYTSPQTFTQNRRYPQVDFSTTGQYEDENANAQLFLDIQSSFIPPMLSIR